MRIIRRKIALEYGGWVIFCFHSVGDNDGLGTLFGRKVSTQLSAWLAEENIPRRDHP